MNKIYEKINDTRNGMYCHALELSSAYELGEIIAQIAVETRDYFETEEEHKAELIDFFETMEVYYYPIGGNENKADEEDLYNFSVSNFMNEFYDSFI